MCSTNIVSRLERDLQYRFAPVSSPYSSANLETKSRWASSFSLSLPPPVWSDCISREAWMPQSAARERPLTTTSGSSRFEPQAERNVGCMAEWGMGAAGCLLETYCGYYREPICVLFSFFATITVHMSVVNTCYFVAYKIRFWTSNQSPYYRKSLRSSCSIWKQLKLSAKQQRH